MLIDALHDYKLRAFDHLAAPVMVAPTVDGTPGTTEYRYCATFRTLVGETIASAVVVCSNGPATLSGLNRIRLDVDAVPPGAQYIRYFKWNGTTYNLLAEVTAAVEAHWDTGAATTAVHPPETNTSGRPQWLMLAPHAGRLAQRSEITDLQALIFKAIRNFARTIHKDGDVIEGCNPKSLGSNQWQFSEGRITLEGFFIPVPAGTITITGTGTERVGLKITPDVVTHLGDVVLRDPDENVAWQYCQPGMDRLIVQVEWTLNDPAQVDIQEFIDGVPKTKTLDPERTVLQRTLATQMHDHAGSFCVRPFQMKADDHPTDATKQRIWIGPGKAYVEGWPVETYDRRYADISRALGTDHRNGSTTGDFLAPGGIVLGTVSDNDFDVNGLKLKLKVGLGNSHTVTFSGNNKTAATVCSDIEAAVNAYPSAEGGDLVNCVAVGAAISIQAAPGKTLAIEAVSGDGYTELGLTVGITNPGGQRIYPCNEKFIKAISDMVYRVTIVEAVTHNGSTHIDNLANVNVASIIGASNSQANAHDGKFDYHLGVDFVKTGDTINFATLGGNDPNPGATYYVKYAYNYTATLASRVLVRVTDARVVKGAEDGQDNLVFTGGSYAKVIDGTPVTGLSGSASDVVRIVQVNNSAGQGQSQYNSYSLLKNSTVMGHATSQIDWSAAGAQGVVPGGQPTTAATYYVTFEFWMHATEGDFVAAQSYDMYSRIEQAPGIASEYDLRDCVDWRTLGTLPTSGYSPTFDFDFYLGRFDKICIDPQGNFNVIAGTPSKKIEIPAEQTGNLTLSLVAIAPYTYGPQDVTIRSVEPIRITQQGLHELLRRVERLEYWNEQKSLEESVAYGPAATGSRGIFTDALAGFGRSDVAFNKNGIKFTAALDTAERCLRLPAAQTAKRVGASLSESSGIKKVGNSIMLDYQPEVYDQQLKATSKININPDDVVSFASGELSIIPEIDMFQDSTQRPDLNADYDNNLSAVLSQLLPEDFSKVAWNSWESNIPQVAETVNANQNATGEEWSKLWTGFGRIQTEEALGQHFVANSWNVGDIWRSGTQKSLQPDKKIVDLGDRVVDLTMATFMRTKDDDGDPFEIELTAQNLIPNGDYAVEIAGKLVNAVATGSSQQGAAYQGKTTIKANASGAYTGKFVMPGKIPTGTATIKTLYTTNPTLSSALHQFYSSGWRTTKQKTTLGFTSAKIITETVQESLQLFEYVDPLAQTFLVKEANVYVSAIGIFFASKSATIPVTCEIRECLNGYPSRKVLASCTLWPVQVNVSKDGTAETIFTFADVLAYQPEEYCIVLKTNCTDYEVWMAELGKADVVSGEIVMAQPAGGVLFHSPNASTWEAMTRADLKYKIYKSNFENACQIVFDNLTGIEANAFVARVEQFLAPGTAVAWSYSIDGGLSWIPFTAGLNTSLSSVVTQVKIRVDVTSIGGTFRIIDKWGTGILFLLHDMEADAVFNEIQFDDPLQYPDKVQVYLDVDADGFDGTGTRNITVYYTIDDGETWVRLKVPTQYSPIIKTEPYDEYLFETPDEASLSGAANATPIAITSAANGFQENAIVTISGVQGNTAANGTWRLKNVNEPAGTAELVNPTTGANSSGNGAYTSGGTMKLAEFDQCRLRIHLATSNQAQTPKVQNVRLSCIEAAAA